MTVNRFGQFNHKEAFCLMNYRCETCGHTEKIWNSRDGVTPFGICCPSCGETMLHIAWNQDRFAPDHQLHDFQKFFRDGTRAEAERILLGRFALMKQAGYPEPEDIDAKIASMLETEFNDGWPMVDIKLPKELDDEPRKAIGGNGLAEGRNERSNRFAGERFG